MLIAFEVGFFFDSVRRATLDHLQTCSMPMTRVHSGAATSLVNQGTAVLTHALRQPELMSDEARRLKGWIEAH